MRAQQQQRTSGQTSWSKEEENALSAGVQRFGEGRWTSILQADSKGDRLLVKKPIFDVQRKWKELKPRVQPKPAAPTKAVTTSVKSMRTVSPVVRQTHAATRRPIQDAVPKVDVRTPKGRGQAHQRAPLEKISKVQNGHKQKNVAGSQESSVAGARHNSIFHQSNAMVDKRLVPSDQISQSSGGVGLFEDPEFPCVAASLFEDDPSRIHPELRWLRPHQYADNPRLFIGGVEPGDVVQGDLGDCWFLSALACVGTDPELIPKLFTTEQDVEGRYDLRFFKNMEWRMVTIDDRIPCVPDPNGGWKPAYGCGMDKNEIWIPLLEKAYAKLHGCYEHLEGGRISQGLQDLTGGACEKMYFDEKDLVAQFHDGTLWERFLQFKNSCDLVGCGLGDPSAAVEGKHDLGILINHAYSVIECREIQGFKLLKCRNPWGKAGEWTGAWSDGSSMWTEHPEVAAALKFEARNDGMFWIEFCDFVGTFNEAYIGHMFDERVWRHVSYGDMFYEDQNGGFPLFSKLYSPNWRSNPQYLLNASPNDPTVAFIQMVQPDSRLDYGEVEYRHKIGFIVVRAKELAEDVDWKDYSRLLKNPAPQELVYHCKAQEHRFVSAEITLPANGRAPFHVIPYIIKVESGSSAKELDQASQAAHNEGRFVIDIFSKDKAVEFAEVDPEDDVIIYEIPVVVDQSNGGGSWKHETWRLSPQFPFKTTDENTEISLVLSAGVEMEHIGLTLFRDHDGVGHIKEFNRDVLQGYSEFNQRESSLLDVTSLPKYDYIVGCCTYKPGVYGMMTLVIYSNKALNWDPSVPVRVQEAGRNTDRLPKCSRKYPLPMGYSNEPDNLRIKRQESHFSERRDSEGNLVLHDSEVSDCESHPSMH